MSKKWLDYLGGNTVIPTGRDSDSGLKRSADLHQIEARYAQQEFDKRREAEKKSVSERIEQANQEQRDRLVVARSQRLLLNIQKECKERLSREWVVVYKLNEQRTRVESSNYLSKREAVETTKVVMGGDLLDLDCGFGGMVMCEDYLFVSEHAAAEALRKYEPGPVALLNGLLAEVAASERPLFRRDAR